MNDIEYWEQQAQKQVYDKKVKVKSGRVAYLLRELLKLPLDSKNIVEVGCGSAFIGYLLSLMFPRSSYTGFEIAPSYINNPLPVEIKEGRITNLSYPGKGADFVFLFDVLEHIDPDERVDGYKEINRILAPGGVVVIHNPTKGSKHNQQFEHILGTAEIASFCNHIENGEIMSWQTLILDGIDNAFNYILMRKG